MIFSRTRVESLATHGVVAGAMRAAEDNGELWDRHTRYLVYIQDKMLEVRT